MPWWPAVWAWLDRATRAEVAPQLRARGDVLMLIDVPDGGPLYNEPDQYYSPDKFGPLAITPAQLCDLIYETLGYGFKGVWLFLGGDDGQNGFPIACAEVARYGPALAHDWRGLNLNEYAVYVPGWDGVWHKPGANGTGWNPPQIKSWSDQARAAGAVYVGIEGGNGYMLCGEGDGDYQPGGNMTGYDLLLTEYGDDQFETGDVWQIIPRYWGLSNYVRPPEQIAHDVEGDPLYAQAHDPAPPWVLHTPSTRGPYVPRIFEYFMYGAVRTTPASQVQAAKAKFAAMLPAFAGQIC